MNLNEIEKILANSTGIRTCEICGLPFRPYHSRQKTCGSPDCRKASHAESARAKAEERKRDDPEGYREKRRSSSKRSRQKRKRLENREAQLKEIAVRWEKQQNLGEKIAEYGDRYGEVSAQKVLATVPKIDVNLGGKDDNTNAEYNDE